MSRKLKRNDVVKLPCHGGLFRFYGRVWRRLDEQQVVVLDCGSQVNIYRDEELSIVDYKGYWQPRANDQPDRWVPMTSLRALKRQAGVYPVSKTKTCAKIPLTPTRNFR